MLIRAVARESRDKGGHTVSCQNKHGDKRGLPHQARTRIDSGNDQSSKVCIRSSLGGVLALSFRG